MIQNVRSGQALTAGLLNNIIAQANGQDIPSNQNFINTDKGTLFVNNHDYTIDSEDGSFNKFLECWVDYAPEISERPNNYVKGGSGSLNMKPYILINLGNDTEVAKENITVNAEAVKGIIIISNKESLDTIVSDEVLNSDGGYIQLAEVDTGAGAPFDVYAGIYRLYKPQSGSNSGSGTDGTVDKANSYGGYVFVISKEDLDDQVKDRILTNVKTIEGLDDVTEIKIVNKKKLLAAVTSEDTGTTLLQNVMCSQDFLVSDQLLSSDSDVSKVGKLKQYSINFGETTVEEELDSGDKIDKVVQYAELYDFTTNSRTKIDKEKLAQYSTLIRFEAIAGDGEIDGGETGDDETVDDGEASGNGGSTYTLEYTPYYYFSSDTEEITGESESDSNEGYQKSIELKDKPPPVGEKETFIKYYQLYGFDGSQGDKPTLTLNCGGESGPSFEDDDSEYDVLVRKTTDNNTELIYTKLKVMPPELIIEGDANGNVPNVETKSVIFKVPETDVGNEGGEGGEDAGGDGNEDDSKKGGYFQLYNFDDKTTVETNISTISQYDILIRDGEELKYTKLNLSAESISSIVDDAVKDSLKNNDIIIPTVDSVISSQKSLDEKESSEGDVYFQLHNFDDKTALTSDISTISQYDILIRDGEELKYTKLSIDLSSTSIELDNKSINYTEEKKVQIFDFDNDDNKSSTNLATLLQASENKSEGDDGSESTTSSGELLFRKDGQLEYLPIGTLSGLSSVSSDLSIELDNKSINYNDENKIQLFDFESGNTITEDLVTLLSNETSEKPQIVIRKDGQINYMSIGTLSGLSSVSSEISVDNKSISYNDENQLQLFDFANDDSEEDEIQIRQSNIGFTHLNVDDDAFIVRGFSDGKPTIKYKRIKVQVPPITQPTAQLSVANDTIIGYALEYSYDYEITLKRGRLTIENNVLKLVPDDTLTQKINTTPISEIK